MYFETAPSPYRAVVCAISRIFQPARYLVTHCTLLALAPWSLLQNIQNFTPPFLNLLQLLAKLIDQQRAYSRESIGTEINAPRRS